MQGKNPLKLDIIKCREDLEALQQELEDATFALESVMPKVGKKIKRKKPAIMNKKDGTLSKRGEAWLQLLIENGLPGNFEGVVEVITKMEDPNANSTSQVKDWLLSLGWKPSVHKDGANGPVPQVRIEGDEGKELAPCVKLLMREVPEIRHLENVGVLSHRIGLLKGFLDNVDEDGNIRAEVNGFTNTLRMKHKVLVNLPKVTKQYGEMIRGALVAPDGYELVGSDVSGLEDTTKRHYIYAFDPDYVMEQSIPGFDPHIDIAKMVGLLTESEEKFFKKYKSIKEEDVLTPDQFDYPYNEMTVAQIHKEFERISVERGLGKTTNFASTYKVGAAKLAKTLGIPKSKAKKLLEAFWKRNWGILAFEDSLSYKEIGDEIWVLNPVNNFWYYVRYKKDFFSAVNQSTGAFLFDMWLKEILDRRPALSGQFHDECIIIIKKNYRDLVRKFLKDCMGEVNKKYRLNVDLDVDVQFGHRYSEIH
jgi:hypothetical protein